MGEFEYAAADDFSKAAARVLKFADDALQDAQNRLSSEGFFRRFKLRRIFEPSMKLARRLLAPLHLHGSAIVKSPELAEAYCRSLSAIVSEGLGAAYSSEVPGATRLATTMVAHMAEATAEVLTKSTHEVCWFGSTALAQELRTIFPPAHDPVA